MKTSIFRLLFVTVFLFIASSLLITNLALSSPLLRGSPLIAETTVTSPPSAEMRSKEKTTMNPSTPSEIEVEETQKTQQPTANQVGDFTKKASQPQETPSESGGPYDMEAIKAFNRALYGS